MITAIFILEVLILLIVGAVLIVVMGKKETQVRGVIGGLESSRKRLQTAVENEQENKYGDDRKSDH